MKSPATRVSTASLGMTTYEINGTIQYAQRAFNELLRTCLSHHGLTVPIWSVLGSLYRTSAQRPSELAAKLHIKPPYISVLVKRLETDGFIECVIIPDDERGKTMQLTAYGKHTVEQVEGKLEHCIEEQFQDVSLQDLQAFFTMADYIATHVKHQ